MVIHTDMIGPAFFKMVAVVQFKNANGVTGEPGLCSGRAVENKNDVTGESAHSANRQWFPAHTSIPT
jgi:hypothetical protein